MKCDYIYQKRLFDLKTVKKINKIVKAKHDPTVADNPAAGVIKTANVKAVAWRHLKKILAPLYDYIRTINNYHFGFDIFPVLDNQMVNVNHYTPVDELGYDWHKDGDDNHSSDIKLTCLLNLSEKKYEGGGLYIGSNKELDFFCEAGDVIVFRSYILHKVDKVISGDRRTLTIFMNGPCLK
jgi:hypothetical protein|tara:strand:+ start:1537 stop:2079 length:543 start_codon:yes stop_codon:yes gene_type:complete